MTPRRARVAALTVAVALAVAVLALVAAMLLYPGGSFTAPATPGYDLLRNYLCDLTRARGHIGLANPGAPFAQAGMIVLAVGLGAFWQLAPRLLSRPRLASPVRATGTLSALALLAVPLSPSLRFPHLHTIAIFAAAIPGLFALALVAHGVLARARRWPLLAVLTVVFLVASATTAALYLILLAGVPFPERWPLPTAQKLAGVALLLWIGVASTRACASP